MRTCDVLIVGGGMAGVSIGAELSRDRSVTVLDMEATLAFHTTGRSAAMFLETYGGPVIRALTVASRDHLEQRQALRPMPHMFVGLSGHRAEVEQLHRDVSALVPTAQLLDPQQVAEVQPLLKEQSVDGAVLEADAMEIDVHAVHQHYVRTLKDRGGTIATSARIERAEHDQVWTLTDAGGETWQAPTVVNAAGAWADDLAETAGARRRGLRPLRRSAFMVDAPPDVRPPMFGDVPDSFYVKPDAGRLLCSPADETPQSPADAKPDELEIARAIEVINEVTTLDVRHVRSAWAGLRTFAADRVPVVGFDPDLPGLFWFAGQGGYGIQIAPALARTGAALVRDEDIPTDVGITREQVAANRAGIAPAVGPC